MNSSASSPRSPRRSARIGAESAERSPDVRRSPPKNFFGGRPADPRGTRRSPRVSARIRANPRRKFFRRASSFHFDVKFDGECDGDGLDPLNGPY